MKFYKKINKIIIVLMVTIFSIFNMNTIHAAGSISISFLDDGGSAQSVFYPDENVTVVISYSNNVSAMWDINVFSNDLSLGSLQSQGKTPFVGTSNSISQGVGQLGVGSYSVSADAGQTATMDDGSPVTAEAGNSFTVKNRPVQPEQPSSGGNSNNDSNELPSDPQESQKQDAIEEQTPEEIEEQKKAREEAEKEAEEARLEEELQEKKTTPMFTEINIISASEKMMGESLTKIATEKDKFDYAYTLPKRVDAFSLELAAVEGATLTYDRDYTIEEGKDSIVVPVKAVIEDVTQDFKITVSKNTEKPVTAKLGETDLVIYDDEILDTTMESFGFKKDSFELGDGKAPFFTKGKISVVLTTKDGKAVWHALDKDNKLGKSGVLYLDEDNNALFILEAEEEVASNSLYQNSYTEKTLPANVELAAVDSTINFDQTYKSWEYDETREVVYGFDESGDTDFYVFGDNKIKAAVVAFDSVDTRYKTATWVLVGTLFAVLGTAALFALTSYRNNKQPLYKKEEEEDEFVTLDSEDEFSTVDAEEETTD